MNRSPRVSTAGASRRTRTYADVPGAISAIAAFSVRSAATVTRAGFCFPAPVHLQAADFDHALAWEDNELGFVVNRSRHERAGHDGAEPFDREHAIDRQSHFPCAVAAPYRCREVDERAT